MTQATLPRGNYDLRIIAGQWRGRRIPMLALDEVRPTTDRIRETVFNWLQPYIAGAYCLDAFAGTGVLGLEALSRGAAHVVFVDKQKTLCIQLQEQLKQFECQQASVLCHALPAEKAKTKISHPFDLVFLDPPYQQNLWLPVLTWLENNKLIHERSLVFFEHLKSTSVTWPKNWLFWREQTAGNVHFGLLKQQSHMEA